MAANAKAESKNQKSSNLITGHHSSTLKTPPIVVYLVGTRRQRDANCIGAKKNEKLKTKREPDLKKIN